MRMRGENPASRDVWISMVNLHKILAQEGYDHALIGGFAMNHYGFDRSTDDIDLAITVSIADYANLAAVLKSYGYTGGLSNKSPEIKGARFAAFNDPTGVRIDILYGDILFIRNLLHYATPHQELKMKIASKESVAAMKYISSQSPTRKHFDQKKDDADYTYIIEELGANKQVIQYLIDSAEGTYQ